MAIRSQMLTAVAAAVFAFSPVPVQCASTPFNDSAAEPGEWGFRPFENRESAVNPPGFVWRPQKNASAYELQISKEPLFRTLEFSAGGIAYNCFCPDRPLPKGDYFWRIRFIDPQRGRSNWSKSRSFTIADGAVAFPLPAKESVFSRIPNQHPRLFVRPEGLPSLRKLASGPQKSAFSELVAQCDTLLDNPPPTAEPPKYPKGTVRGSDPWRKIWWGNRRYTQRVLNNAATLGFVYQIGGDEKHGQLARRILMEAARWDPRGSTGYRYNDEAGMPYNYGFSRTYTFVNDLLTESERRTCRKVMRIRGREMYEHLHPRHLWKPYGSHANRAWHFLGEIGFAFFDEIPEAGEWAWFAMNVFQNVYPVWSDTDGGWHEGTAYWSSYLQRFTMWADVMKAATGVDAFDKPFFSEAGYYPMYLQPPGTKGGGFGDLTATRSAASNKSLMAVFASQSANPYWQWYVDANGGGAGSGDFLGFLRKAQPVIAAKPPTDLPTSRVFRGIGQAMLNTTLIDAKNNVELIFKSSPFGTQSHGYESQNSFLLYAFGERLLIRSGYRDSYGSKHHKEWMWHTKSVNNITVNGEGQKGHSAAAVGRITAFHTSPDFDFVQGEAADAYFGKLDRYTRSVYFLKPDWIVIHDQLEAPVPSTFEWRLHSPTPIKTVAKNDLRIVNNAAACDIAFLHPTSLDLSITDKYDTPPRSRIKLTEWHLTAKTPGRQKRIEFITLLRPHRNGEAPATKPVLTRIEGGYALESGNETNAFVLLLAQSEGTPIQRRAFRSHSGSKLFLLRPDGKIYRTWRPTAAQLGAKAK